MRKIKMNSGIPINGFFLRDTTFPNLTITADDECPHCHYAMLWDFYISSNKYTDFEANNKDDFSIFSYQQCPQCHRGFVVEYRIHKDKSHYTEKYHFVYPYIRVNKDFGVINTISPRFVDIYSQCIAAKNQGYFEIYGMGLRKAIECLVKDFALYLHPDTEAAIASKPLASCIDTYITDQNTQKMAHACRIIGNNETHWKDENTSDDVTILEEIIPFIISDITQHITTEKAAKYLAEHDKKKEDS